MTAEEYIKVSEGIVESATTENLYESPAYAARIAQAQVYATLAQAQATLDVFNLLNNSVAMA